MGTLATGDVLGGTRLYRYPCTHGRAMYKQYGGHSWRGGGVSKLSFVAQTAGVVTLGRSDRVVVQWRHEFEDMTSEDELDGEELFMRMSEENEESERTVTKRVS